MKTILIATDFSAASRNASFYGIQFAKALDLKIILFNAYHVPSTDTGLCESVSRYAIMMETDKRLLEEADSLDPKLDIVEILCDEGLPVDAIIKAANEEKVDFIIAGKKSIDKNIGKGLVCTAIELASRSNIPVILIPENAIYAIPETRVYVSEMRVNTGTTPKDKIKSIIELY